MEDLKLQIFLPLILSAEVIGIQPLHHPRQAFHQMSYIFSLDRYLVSTFALTARRLTATILLAGDGNCGVGEVYEGAYGEGSWHVSSLCSVSPASVSLSAIVFLFI